MNRTTSLVIGLFFAIVPAALGQQSQPPAGSPEDDLASAQLIAWSSLQKPQPAPQPLPPPDTAIPGPDPQQNQNPQTPADPDSQTPAAQSFTGKIVQDGGKFVLKSSKDTTYGLEGAGNLQQYENKTVKISGRLDGENRIHVEKIELLS